MVSRKGDNLHFHNEKMKTTIILSDRISNTNTSVIFPHWKVLAEYIKKHDLDCAIDQKLVVELNAGKVEISVAPITEDQVFRGGWVVPALYTKEKQDSFYDEWEVLSAGEIKEQSQE